MTNQLKKQQIETLETKATEQIASVNEGLAKVTVQCSVSIPKTFGLVK